MATIGDLIIKIGADISGIQSGLGLLNSEVQKSTGEFTKLGLEVTAAGAAITAFMGISIKKAAEEETIMARLSNTLKNVGVNYDDVKDSLDSVIRNMESATGIAHDKLYGAFQMLLNITGDYDASLRLLPIAMDLAAGAGIDYATAAKLVGKVEEGNTAILARYGIIVAKGATQTEILEAITKRFGGSAVTVGNQTEGAMNKIKNSFDNLQESVGKLFLTSLKPLFEELAKIIDKVTEWGQKNPELFTGIVMIVTAIGLLMAALGPLIMMLPGIIAFLGLPGMAGAIAVGAGAFIAALPMIAAFGAAIAAVIFLVSQLIALFFALKDAAVPIATLKPGTEELAAKGRAMGLGPKYAYASGGIASSPQIASLGEAGPEAVIPLSKMGGMGGTNVTIQAGAFMGSREDARSFARMLQELMRNENNTRTYGRLV